MESRWIINMLNLAFALLVNTLYNVKLLLKLDILIHIWRIYSKYNELDIMCMYLDY